MDLLLRMDEDHKIFGKIIRLVLRENEKIYLELEPWIIC